MENRTYPRIVIAAAFLVALAAAIYILLLIYDPILRPILDVAPPFVIAIVLALLLDPLIDRLQTRGLSRGQGVAIVGLSFVVLFLLAGFLLVPRIAQQATDLAQNYPEYTRQASERLDRLMSRQKPLLARLKLPTSTREWSRRFSNELSHWGEKSAAAVAGVLSALLAKILWVIIIPLATLWLLRDIDRIEAKLVHFLPHAHKDRVVELAAAVGSVFGRYVRGMLAVATLFSLVSMLVLTIARLPYGLVIGAVAGLLYLVPYVGVLILVLIMGMSAAIYSPDSLVLAATLMAWFLVQSFIIFDLLITPNVVGGSVGVHPVLALFSLALGARLFGVLGLVIAVPVAASLQVALGQLFPGMVEQVPPQTRRGKDDGQADEPA